ncbi:FMN reductase [Streptomonospora nanhaiensis]|uniref:FMN reductase n=1 Tax=Streptomonospora nanhaiensis TaxID=1323731 RepID=A0A853BI90_9ACTN|nr:FMN reductase [Streptomonospora nanhaiensis]NYI94297.1 FMN reductase [Streptomonospora nanhaiensis]
MSAPTPEPLRLVAVSAGLGQPSATRLLVDRLTTATADRLTEQGAAPAVRVVELREHASDIANAMVTGFPGSGLRSAVDVVTGADGLIAATPVFTASYSGLFKSFVDVLEDTAVAGKPVLLAATGGTMRHSLVLEHTMRPLFAYLRALTVPTGVFAASDDWGAGGDPYTADLPRRIDRAAGELAALMLDRPRPRGAEATAEAEDEDAVVPFEERLAAVRRPGGR